MRSRRTAVVVVAVAAFLFSVGKQQISVLAADATKRVATNTPSKSQPIVQKKVGDFGVSEVALINAAIQKGWSDHNLVPSKPAADGEWCRRVFLDLVGRVPTVDELNAYLADKKHDKRERLVDQLLGQKYSDEYTQNWTTIWINILIGRTG